MNNTITILNETQLTPHQRRYWASPKLHAQLANQRVTLIDPWRTPIRTLRHNTALHGQRVYRASTGGRWGKSAQITTI